MTSIFEGLRHADAPHANRSERLGPFLIALGLTALVARYGIPAVMQIEWIYDMDFYRDIGYAENIKHGGLGEDGVYLGERSWSTPLVPAIVAVLSALLDAPTNVIYARIGAFLTLLAPLAFYWMASRLFNRWLAVAAVACFLFLNGGHHADWSYATYSPLPFTNLIVQSLLYVTIATFARYLNTGAVATLVSTGVLLGVTCLGHAGPAVLGAALITLTFGARFVGLLPPSHSIPLSRARLTKHFLVIGAVASLVASPVFAPLAFEYHFHTKNPSPSNWMGGHFHFPLTSQNSLLGGESLLVWGLAALGLVGILKNARRHVGCWALLAWTLSSFLLFVYAVLAFVAARRGVWLPNVVPAFHYYFSLHAAKAVLFACGLWLLVGWLSQSCARVVRLGVLRTARASMILGSLLIAVTEYPTYHSRESLRRPLDHDLQPQRLETLKWIRANSDRHAVFLAEDDVAQYVVAGAGRKTVAIHRFFSNPFVSYETRNQARNAMFSALRANDSESFRTLASTYSVDYVLVEDSLSSDWLAVPPAVLMKAHAAENIAVFSVRDAR